MVRKQLIICRTIWIAATWVYPRPCETSIEPQAKPNTIFVKAGMDPCTYRSHESAFKLIGVQ
jgi:hypothetical protein